MRFSLLWMVVKVMLVVAVSLAAFAVVAWIAAECGAEWPYSQAVDVGVVMVAMILAGPVPICVALAGLIDVARD